MFCEKCGQEMKETDLFCVNCGSRTEKRAGVGVNKKYIAVIFAVVVVVAVIVGISNISNVNASPEKVAEAAVISEYEIDIDLMIKCFPDFTIRELALDYGLSPNAGRSEVKRAIKEAYRYEKAYTVSNIKTELLSCYDIEEITFLKELYDDMTNEEYEAITQIATVKVSYQVDGENESTQLTCVEIKGKWYLLRRG